MKQEDIEVGKTYLTRVGEFMARVVVIARVDGDSKSPIVSKRRTKFRVRRVDKNEVLPKLRPARALHPNIEG